ncbi:MAG: 50S ribosomal protein L17 [Alphaproteobacteria bacterium]
MRHRFSGRQLNRTSSHRKALFQNLAIALIREERIKTTLPKAKELRPIVEKLITMGKKGDLHNRRRVLSQLQNKECVIKLIDTLSKRFKKRNGGYTRILKLGSRYGDNAPMAVIEFVTDVKKDGKVNEKTVISSVASDESAHQEEATTT